MVPENQAAYAIDRLPVLGAAQMMGAEKGTWKGPKGRQRPKEKGRKGPGLVEW